MCRLSTNSSVLSTFVHQPPRGASSYHASWRKSSLQSTSCKLASAAVNFWLTYGRTAEHRQMANVPHWGPWTVAWKGKGLRYYAYYRRFVLDFDFVHYRRTADDDPQITARSGCKRKPPITCL
jgi:hypothetical protein